MYVGKGVFVGRNELQVGDRTLRFRKAIIATGGRATLPPIPGLAEAPHMTNATLFNLTALPPRFVVIGGGPIGLEMAQAFRRFGSEVTLLEALPRILGPEDPDASATLQKVLEEDGVRVVVGAGIQGVRHELREPWPEICIDCSPAGGEPIEVKCDALLVAAGRAANVEGLGLEAAGVEVNRFGIAVNDDLSTTNPDIFAAGDCCDKMALRFTHTAGAMASMAITNSLFGGRGPPVLAPATKISELVVPRCTYTEPEVASCGIANLAQAEREGVEVDVYAASLEHNDRIILEGDDPGGFVKVLCRKGTDKIVGGVIVAERAGDMLAEITLAAQHGLPISAIGHTIHPYPTSGEGVQQCCLGYVRKNWERLDGVP
jgi:pyruvate/2-oxoglutarate dehydrogenase complex dihydrolipoamide dehydrogenase (E3) component